MNNKGNCTVKEKAERWLLEKQFSGTDKNYIAYYYAVYTWIIPYLGNYKVCEINDEKKQEFIIILEDEGLLKYTVQTIFRYLENIVGTRSTQKFKFNESTEEEVRFLSEEETRTLFEFCSKENNNVIAGILIVLGTGLKVGELMNLKWGQLDFVNSNIEIKDMESNKVRKVFIPPMISKSLILFRQDGEKYVINGTEKRPDRRKILCQVEAAGRILGIKSLSFNTLRNTYIINALQKGVNPIILKDSLGLSLYVLERYYAYVKPDESEEFNKLNDLYLYS